MQFALRFFAALCESFATFAVKTPAGPQSARSQDAKFRKVKAASIPTCISNVGRLAYSLLG
jgi:hypothetical protein